MICLATLRTVVDNFLQLRFFRVGSSFWSQSRGTPIGGPFSSALLEGLLMCCEYTYDLQHRGRSCLTACGRYADDIIMMSHVKCRACLRHMSFEVYSPALTFDPDDSQEIVGSVVVQKYLDFVILFSHTDLLLSIIHKNMKYAISGNASHIRKHSLEPFTGDFSRAVRGRHRAELVGRLARWRHVWNNRVNVIFLIVIDMLLYIRAGFGLSHIRSLWTSVDLAPGMSELVWLSFDLISFTCRDHVKPVTVQLSEMDAPEFVAWVASLASSHGVTDVMGPLALMCRALDPPPAQTSRPVHRLLLYIGQFLHPETLSRQGVPMDLICAWSQVMCKTLAEASAVL